MLLEVEVVEVDDEAAVLFGEDGEGVVDGVLVGWLVGRRRAGSRRLVV